MATKVAVPKIKIDRDVAQREHHVAATTAAQDRFSQAQKITERQPTAFTVAAVEAVHVPAHVQRAVEFSWEACVPGAIVRVPLELIDLNPLGPRHFYGHKVTSKVASTFKQGQDDAAHAYVENQRVKLIDGKTRFLSAKYTGIGFLDLKFEKAPASKLELFKRASALNDNRSAPTALDYAVSLKNLLDQGAVESQKDLQLHVPGPDGKSVLTESTVSQYLRIARMPEQVQEVLAEEPEIFGTAILYALSELFIGTDEDPALRSTRTGMAVDVAEEIKRRKLNKVQATALVKSKLEGPKRRDRSDSFPIPIWGHKGSLKISHRKGRLEFSVSGMTKDELVELHKRLIQLTSEAAATTSGSST